MLRKDRIILTKILSEIEIAENLLGNSSLDEFTTNEMLKRAIGMTVINIGELTKSISDELRMQYPDVPWRSIAGMRDVAAHKYQTLRMEDMYNVVVADLPEMKANLKKILDSATDQIE